ncbi:MAG: hypothetical protein KDE55_23680, partial [Novosphingobium sp.]|nr:hypothetical protein [Novosphingobium sp.]
PEVTGDGVRSVRELVAELNKGRTLPGAHSPRRLISVPLDDAADAHLARQGLTADAVPDAGRVVTLRSNANISSGGSVEDWTDRAHPSVIEAAEALSRALKIHCGGIDFMSTDITRSLSEGNGNFIEFNLTPALTGATLIGWSTQDVCKAALLPETGRIPLQIIVVPEDKLDMVIDRVQSGAMTRGAGWATHDKAQLGFLDLEIRPLHPWSGIETLLMHRTLESATLILSSTMIRRHGLPVDHGDKITLIDNDLPDVWLRVLQDATPEPLQLATL